MLLPGSTTRHEDSNRFKHREPRWPVNGLTPTSPHGHGPNDAHRGDYCGAYDCVHERVQVEIENSPAPIPINPEDRASRQIHEWQEILDAGGLDRKTEREIRSRIGRLKETIDEYSVNPTTFAPEAPGGTGNLKAKAIWEISGLDFRVQAHTKGEAVQAFALALRKRGETGRFSVMIAHPRRVKP